MQATDFIKLALNNSYGWTMGLMHDMKETPLVSPTPNGGNHPLWVLGHLTYSESNLLDCLILGKENRFPEWEKIFWMGTTPTTNPDDYPTFDEVATKFDEVRASTLAHLETLSDADLEAKSHAPEEWGEGFSTVAGCFSAMILHAQFHAGQVADARRAAGKPVLMA